MIPYFSFSTEVSFLRIKQWVFRKYDTPFTSFWIVAFYIHVFSSILAILAGFTQFFKRFLKNNTHRIMGKVYVFSVLFLSGTSGLVMSTVANGGITSIIGFILLSVLWLYTTYMAYYWARKRNFEKHGAFMYRSYALTLAAVTLRVYKWIWANGIDPDMEILHPMDLYRVVAWLGWVPNLIIAEILIRKKHHLKMLSIKKRPQ